jgi:hypothetical protein
MLVIIYVQRRSFFNELFIHDRQNQRCSMHFHNRIIIVCVFTLLTTWPTFGQNAAPDQPTTAPRQRAPSSDEARVLPAIALPVPQYFSAVTLTSLAEVQKEIELTADQTEQLNAARKLFAEKQRELLSEFQKRAAALNESAENEARALLNQKQGTRLAQLQLQRRGASALVLAEIADKLALTADQREKLARMVTGVYKPESRYPEMIAVLTNQQRGQWDEMLGANFEFPVPPRTRAPSASELRLRSGQFIIGQISTNRGRFRPPAVPVALTVRGPASPFLYQSVVNDLNLDDEQKLQIQTIGTEDADAIGAIDPETDTDIAKKVDAIDKTTQQKLDKVLTDEQRKKMRELLYR